MRLVVVLIGLLVFPNLLFSNFYKDYIWRHYTTEDGLSQNSVMSILQDQRGYMWFATWDGICRFDGYNFQTYKVRPGDDVYLTSSRIDKLVEDKWGFIWLYVYGKNVVRFDPDFETFLNVPDYSKGNRSVREILTLNNGVTWLITEFDGAIRALTDTTKRSVTCISYSKKSGLLESNYVNSIIEDQEGNEWILTDNGISVIEKGTDQTFNYFYDGNGSQVNNGQQAFFAAEDIGREIWLGSTGGRVWRYIKEGKRFILLQFPFSSNVESIHQLGNNNFMLITSENGIWLYDSNRDFYEPIYSSGKSNRERINTEVYQATSGDIWIQQHNTEVLQYQRSMQELIVHPVSSLNKDGSGDPDFIVHEDVNGILWLHPYGGGLYVYDGNDLSRFFDENESVMKFSDRLHSMHSDRQGNLWMSTRSKGLERFVFPDKHFSLLEINPEPQFINDNDVRAVFQDSSERFWVSTKAGQLTLYGADGAQLGFMGKDGRLHSDAIFSLSNVYSIFEDRHANLWIATKGEGVYKASAIPGFRNRFSLEQFSHVESDLYSLSHNDVYHIHEDKTGNIWIATYGGGINLLREEGGRVGFISHRNHFLRYPFSRCYRVRYITSCDRGFVYVGTTHGLVVFNMHFDEPENIDFRHFSYIPRDRYCLSNNDVHGILVAKSGDVYLATYGGGLNVLLSSPDESKFKFKSYTREDGLPTDALLSVMEDDKGYIWLALENGLSRLNPQTEVFRNFNKTDFSRVLSFSEGVGQQLVDGSMVFGTNIGVLKFYPDSVIRSAYVPDIVFTEFRLLNRRIHPGAESILERHIDATDHLVLKHNQNIISFGFAALDMKYPEAVKYAAMLEGLDNEWVNLDGQRMINFTNLPHGEFNLKVRSTDSDGVWVDNAKSVKITILPSFWVTTWAYVIYMIVFLLISGMSFYVLLVIYRLRHRIAVDKQILDMKLDFFTNISHELRTPLTLIHAPLEQLLADETIAGEKRESLETVERNSSRMLRLINQLLDFVKINNQKMKMTVEQIQVFDFVNEVMDNFRLNAIDLGIEFSIENNTREGVVWADADKFEKIVFNLLSNAFKFLDGGRFIKLVLEEDDESMRVLVIDDGAGIRENKKTSLFQRFENTIAKGRNWQPSTGIGLSIVKEMVEMHKGEILVESGQGRGTIFKLILMKGLTHFDENVEILDALDENSNVIKKTDIEAISGEASFEEADEIMGLPNLLLVEDNGEVRRFIRGILAREYNVIEAADGRVGYELALKVLPDIIISDLMMPERNGLELLQDIRGDFNTSHIPFVMLTAKANEESQLEGIQMGADDYITKPFSPAYLQSRIENLLNQRRNLQLHYQGQTDAEGIEIKPNAPEVTSLDEDFLNKLKNLMEENIENSSLVVDDLVQEMAVSRSVFFKKLKALTGLAPIEFIREMRLQRAVQLINSGQYNMTQIAFMVGLNDSRYFSKCFKQRFGETPTEFKNKAKKN